MRPIRLAALSLIFAAWAGTISATEILNFPKVSAPVSKVNGVPDACLEWTDGCRVCSRPKGGEPACSNVGIACVPQTIRCTRP